MNEDGERNKQTYTDGLEKCTHPRQLKLLKPEHGNPHIMYENYPPLPPFSSGAPTDSSQELSQELSQEYSQESRESLAMSCTRHVNMVDHDSLGGIGELK